jgi:hypothetical protein
MRVLWFTNRPLIDPQNPDKPSAVGAGQWMTQLLGRLEQRSDLEIGVATAVSASAAVRKRHGNTWHFIVPQPRRFSPFRERRRDVAECVAIVREFQPDLIHFHGAERFFGVLRSRSYVDVPSVWARSRFFGA